VGERNDASDDFYLCIQWPTTLYLIHAPEINFWSTFFLGYYSGLMADLRAGDSVDFGVSRMSSARVEDMQRLGYFGGGVARAPGAEEVPEPEGELVVFGAFFAAGLRLPAHRFVGEVLRRFNVQMHQLTPNAVVALSKYVWATSSYGGQPSVEVFAKHYCLH
jgi:hypothetical protein